MLYQNRFHDQLSPAALNVTGILHIRQRFEDIRLFPWHCHAHYELHFFHDPLVSMPAERQNVLRLYAPFQPHTMDFTGYGRCMMLQFTHAFLCRAIPALPDHGVVQLADHLTIQRDDPLDRALRFTSTHLMTACEATDWADFNRRAASYYTIPVQMGLNGTLLTLLSLLLRSGAGVILPSSINLEDSPLRALLIQIMRDPKSTPSMAEAARSTHMSYSAFSRAFRTTVGCSYPDFCNMARISQAEEMLRFEHMNSTEIAHRLNFGSTSYFNRVFRQLTGMTPTAYRQKLGDESISAK